MLDDVKDFAAMDKALSNLGLTSQERLAIYTTVAAVLHLGNISFEDNPEDTKGGLRFQILKIKVIFFLIFVIYF